MRLVDEYKKIGRLYNQTASKVEQIALCQYIRDGHLSAQLRKQKKKYAAKTRFICERARETLPGHMQFCECSASHLALLRLKTEKTAEQCAAIAEENGLRLKPMQQENSEAVLMLSLAGLDLKNCDDVLHRLIASFGGNE